MWWKSMAVAGILGLGVAWVAAHETDFEYPATGLITGKNYYCSSGRYHGSLDIAAPCGRCVYAGRGGTAYYYGGCGTGCYAYSGGKYCNGGSGNYVRILHGAGYASRYKHGRAGTGRSGSVRDSQRILRIGSTGYSTGPHVHYDIWRNGVRLTAWLYSARPCGSTVYAGYGINYNFPGIGYPGSAYGPHGCN